MSKEGVGHAGSRDYIKYSKPAGHGDQLEDFGFLSQALHPFVPWIGMVRLAQNYC